MSEKSEAPKKPLQTIENSELEQFIGIYPKAVPKDTCSELENWFNMLSEQDMTMTSYEELQGTRTLAQRNDEVSFIPSGIPESTFPSSPVKFLWGGLKKCFDDYAVKYAIDIPVYSHTFKIHKVLPSGGYHIFHHEDAFAVSTRMLAWMIVIKAPEKGGETEFLYQSIRVEPKVGQLTIWPSAFTHKHRGNPPLEGEKIYATGWFNMSDQGGPLAGIDNYDHFNVTK